MNHATWMRRCLALAGSAQGRTAPNPMVGAVVVRDGQSVAEGFHARAGEPHAEVMALQQARENARGATLYVNLEPCSHHGRTPPCTEAILRAGVAHVVIGMCDPNPTVNGRGVRRLRDSGLEVDVGTCETECRELNRAFVSAMERGRPWVVLKAAATLDGRIATEGGESRWITGPEARRHVHGLRDLHDGILVGSGTALADDPRLTCRVEGGRDPIPVLLDGRLRVPSGARMFARGAEALVYSLGRSRSDHPATIVPSSPAPAGGVLLLPVLEDLVGRGIHSLLVEGGGRVHRAFFDSGLFDSVLLYLAPRLLAGGPGWLAGPGVGSLAESFELRVVGITRLGADLLLELRRRDS